MQTIVLKEQGFVILTDNIKNDFIDLFVAGFVKCLELNKETKWHTTDLTKQNELYYCKIKSTVGTSYYRETLFIDGKWNIVMGEVIAWCEMPEFEEVNE